MSDMEKAIILTAGYFSIFSFPLTKIELWHNLYWSDNINPDIADFNQSLEKLLDNKVIINKQGFFCLANSIDDVIKRQQNYRDSFKKYELARRVCRLIALIPFVKAVYVCNSLAYNNSRQSGDIDLFIICQPQRLWLVRLLSVGLLQLLGMRPTVNNKKNKIDPTFFASANNLNFQSLFIDNDVYLLYWLSQLSPIYDPENYLTQIIKANPIIKKNLPNSLAVIPQQRRVVKNIMMIKILRQVFKLLLDYNFLETKARVWQEKIMPADLKSQINKTSDVVINQNIIKLHKNDRRREYAKKWQDLLRRYCQSYER